MTIREIIQIAFKVNKYYRSKNCTPLMEAMPIYKNTPKSTAIGISRNNGAIVTERPIIKATQKPEMRCSFTSMIRGDSPGA